MRDIVDDAHREAPQRLFSGGIVEDGDGHCRVEVFGRKAVSSADDADRAARLLDGGHHVEQQRLGLRARLFRAVEHGDGAHAFGYNAE